jgi:hypothetical protein
VDVKGLLGEGANGLDDQGPNGDVGDKATIHHVNMNPIGSGLIGGLDFFPQTAKVRR